MSAKPWFRVQASRPIRSVAIFLFAFVPMFAAYVALGQTSDTAPGDANKIDREDTAACLGCHSEALDKHKAVDEKLLAKSPHKEMKCQDCHSSFDEAPHTKEMLAEKTDCLGCHTDQDNLYQTSTHSNKDKAPGDHPNCISCHGGGDAHAVVPAATLDKKAKAELCSSCHREKERMQRYGVDTDAVSSYEESYHGKALLIFKAKGTAVCSDCHQAHAVLNPHDERASTNRNNGAKLCSQPECHAGANVNFAMSGANHLRLKFREDPILNGVNVFFQFLVAGVMLFLMGGIALDLRMKVFGPKGSKGGKVVGFAIALTFLMAAIALALAVFGRTGWAARCIEIAVGSLVFAYLASFIKRPRGSKAERQEHYHRMSLAHRWQHGLLMVCFIALLATGLPLHFPKEPWLQNLYEMIGGITVARPIHRIAAVGLILVWSWHLIELLIRWKRTGFAFHALTMLPNKKDVHDFFLLSMYYLGLEKEEPKYDRFHFRQKLDYLAEYWGIPIMVVSGFLLWFPIYWGNRLPEQALSIAIVAHGWEATLAFLAIVLWHLYNEPFNPETFPNSKVWITGKMSREEMERSHPLWLEKIDQQSEGATPETPDTPGKEGA